MNSEFERFANQVKEHIFENVADRDNLLIELHNTQKVNQMDQIFLTVRHKDCNVAPSVPLSAAFEAYKDGESLENILHSIENSIVSHTPTQDIDVKYVTEYDNVKDQIIPKIVNADMNKELLDRVPHFDLGDLSVLFAIKLDHPEIGGGQITVTNQVYDGWGVDDSLIMENALANMKESTQCKDLFGVVADMNPEMADMFPPLDNGPLVISNDDMLFGATSIMNMDVMKTLTERFGDGVMIIPSSVHECLVLKDEHSQEQKAALNSMVHEVNQTTVAKEDFLSDHIYHFNGEKLMMIDRTTLEQIPMELVSAQTGKVFELDNTSADKNKEKGSVISKLQEKQGIVNIDDHKNNKRDDIAL